MKAPLTRMLTVFCLVGTLPVMAEDASLSEDYNQALQSLNQNDLSFADLNRWKKLDLYPHLVTHWVMRHPEAIDTDWFATLLLKPEWQAAGWEFRDTWLEQLAQRGQWYRYVVFDQAWSGAGHPCRRFQAQQALGEPLADEQLHQLWLTANSLPSYCDPLLARLRQDEDYNELVWQRQLLAFAARNTGMLRYLNDQYDDPQWRQRGQRLRAIYLSPAGLFNQSYNPNESWQRDLALAAIDRLAFRAPQIASNFWVDLIKQTPGFSQAEIQSTSTDLGIAMAKLALPQADYWLNIADPKHRNEEAQHWRLQIALADNDWIQIATLYRALDDSLQHSSQWRYWSAIAERHLDMGQSADQQLASLAQERSYYGFLAAAALGQPAQLNQDEQAPINSRRPVAKLPALQRALALYDAGDIVRAQIEWNLALDDLSPAQMMEAAQLAQSRNWYHKASQTAGLSGRYGELSLRYPTPFADLVGELTATAGVPPYWLYGVMRQESHFMTQARSPVGARGLMQLMPYTARSLAIKAGMQLRSDDDLNDPVVNITLGRNYLNQMQRRFGNPVYATAAYNAGPTRVSSWLRRYPADLRVWIESIPFDETRQYVKSVLTYAQIYAMRDGQNWTLANWLDQPSLAVLDDGS